MYLYIFVECIILLSLSYWLPTMKLKQSYPHKKYTTREPLITPTLATQFWNEQPKGILQLDWINGTTTHILITSSFSLCLYCFVFVVRSLHQCFCYSFSFCNVAEQFRFCVFSFCSSLFRLLSEWIEISYSNGIGLFCCHILTPISLELFSCSFLHWING